METIYYYLNAARVTRGGSRKVSGGEELRCVVLPRTVRSAPADGKILDLTAYRQALEPQSAPPAEEMPRQGEATAPKGRPSPWLVTEVCASAAVVLCTALTALGMLLV